MGHEVSPKPGPVYGAMKARQRGFVLARRRIQRPYQNGSDTQGN